MYFIQGLLFNPVPKLSKFSSRKVIVFTFYPLHVRMQVHLFAFLVVPRSFAKKIILSLLKGFIYPNDHVCAGLF